MLKDRVKVNIDTLGSGNLTVGSAYSGFQDFGAFGSGNIKTYYGIVAGSDWETGEGTYISSSNTFNRDIVFESSNNNQLIDISQSSTLFVTYPAKTSIVLDSSTSPSSGQFLYSNSNGTFTTKTLSSSDINGALANSPVITGNVSLDGTVDYTLLDTSPTIVDLSSSNAIKYLIKAEKSGDVQILECLAVYKESNVYITLYGLLYNNQQLVRIDAQMYNGYINLYATATYPNTYVKIYKILI